MSIGEVKTVSVDGKDYEIIKKGVNTVITVQSIFLELISKTTIDQDKNISENDLNMSMMIAMRGPILNDIKSVVIECVSAPTVTSESYDNLTPESVTQLFMAIYYFYTAKADKKKEKPGKS